MGDGVTTHHHQLYQNKGWASLTLRREQHCLVFICRSPLNLLHVYLTNSLIFRLSNYYTHTQTINTSACLDWGWENCFWVKSSVTASVKWLNTLLSFQEHSWWLYACMCVILGQICVYFCFVLSLCTIVHVVLIAVIRASLEKRACSQLPHAEWMKVIFAQKLTAVHGHRQPSTETRSAAPAGVPTCPLQSPGGWREAAPPRAAIVMNYFLEAMMWICIIPWHLASLSTHYQCWVSGIFECMRLCVWVCARGIKYPSLTFSLAVHVVLQEEATRACQSWTAQHIFLVPSTMCVYLCVRLHMCVTVVFCLFFLCDRIGIHSY